MGAKLSITNVLDREAKVGAFQMIHDILRKPNHNKIILGIAGGDGSLVYFLEEARENGIDFN